MIACPPHYEQKIKDIFQSSVYITKSMFLSRAKTVIIKYQKNSKNVPFIGDWGQLWPR